MIHEAAPIYSWSYTRVQNNTRNCFKCFFYIILVGWESRPLLLPSSHMHIELLHMSSSTVVHSQVLFKLWLVGNLKKAGEKHGLINNHDGDSCLVKTWFISNRAVTNQQQRVQNYVVFFFNFHFWKNFKNNDFCKSIRFSALANFF